MQIDKPIQSSFTDKVHPHDVQIEEAILGALMIEKNLERMLYLLEPEYFYKDAHRLIIKSIKELSSRSSPIDILTVTNELKKSGELEIIGGPYFITSLTNRIASAANIEVHILILKEAYIRRKIIDDSTSLAADSFNESVDVFSIVERTTKNIEEINEVIYSQKAPETFQEQLKKSYKAISVREELFKKGIVSGIPSGFKDLDKVTYGWQNGDLIILASRPSMGKTALSLYFSKYAAHNSYNPVIFSLEMSSKKLIDRMIVAEAKVESFKFNSGGLNAIDWQNINQGIGKLEKLNMTIDDFSGASVEYIRSRCRLLKSKGKCDIIFIDYLQLVHSKQNKNRNREQEISEISRGCKGIAKELNVPVIALCQLSRAVETRGGEKRPMLSDLRESGAIEQDADIVIFPYRPAYYKLTDKDGGDLTGFGELIIAKNRDGSLGDIPFRHNQSMTEFYEFEKQPF